MITKVASVSQEELAILRRIAERGLQRAQEKEDNEFVDIFQHMLDEIWWLDDAEDNID